jgi:flagellar motor switch/type III secretory pathway protein FliN
MTSPAAQAASSEVKAGSAPPPAGTPAEGTHAGGPGSALLHPPGEERSAPPSDPSRHPALAALPLQLDVVIPIPNFRVRELLAMDKDTVLESSWPYAEDVPVWCGGAQLVWSEFEVVDNALAVRVTRVL